MMLNSLTSLKILRTRSSTNDQCLELTNRQPTQVTDPDTHVYEEISDLPNTSHNGAQIIYLDLVNDVPTKKIVRFNNTGTSNPTNETLTSFKCILKKPIDQLHSPLSSHSSTSSTSSGQIYTNTSIDSNTSSTHSATFNSLIDTFLSRFQTVKKTSKSSKTSRSKSTLNRSLGGDSTSSSSTSSLASLNRGCGNDCPDKRLSYRVTDFTLNDLKVRQRMIYQSSLMNARMYGASGHNGKLTVGCTSAVQV